MVYISINQLWKSEFDNIVSKKDKIQGSNNSQIKLEVRYIHEKGEKVTTIFEPTDDSDAINTCYLDEDEKRYTVKFHI